jgi:hypothetical protein
MAVFAVLNLFGQFGSHANVAAECRRQQPGSLGFGYGAR